MNLLLAVCLLAATAATSSSEPNRSSLRAMPVTRTPEANTIILTIAVPKNGQVINNPAWIQFRIDGYSLGSASSQFDRSSELAVTDKGQTVHVVVDNDPYFPINEPALDPFNEGGFYYDMSYKFKIPHTLKEGMHTVRVFPARSFGESLKGENSFHAVQFYIGEDTGEGGVDLSQPYLTYNEPSDQMPLSEKKPILLDFYICNTELSADGYKVRLTVDGKVVRTITSWQPYYLYGLKSGKHTIRLELLDSDNALVPGPFNDVTRTITVR